MEAAVDTRVTQFYPIVQCACIFLILIGAMQGCSNPSDALEKAILERNCSDVAIAIEAGADIDVSLEDGITALMLASVGPDPNFVQCVLQHRPNPNIADRTGRTALMYAIEPDVVRLLIEAGADVNTQDNTGRTALMFAQRPEAVRILLDHGADPYIEDHQGRDMFDRNGWDDIRAVLREYQSEFAPNRGRRSD